MCRTLLGPVGEMQGYCHLHICVPQPFPSSDIAHYSTPQLDNRVIKDLESLCVLMRMILVIEEKSKRWKCTFFADLLSCKVGSKLHRLGERSCFWFIKWHMVTLNFGDDEPIPRRLVIKCSLVCGNHLCQPRLCISCPGWVATKSLDIKE